MHEAAQLRHEHEGPGWAIYPPYALFTRRHLTWWPEIGVGYYPVEAGIEPYDQEYFDRFARDAQTPLGRALMQGRHEFVERHWQGALVDIGIGSGAFIERRLAEKRPTWGYDVNPAGIKWLAERRLRVDPHQCLFDAMTLWDVLEHVPYYPSLLDNARKWLFVSLPIFRNAEHVLRSKHFRPTEHVWYFTRDGLIYAMKQGGFALVSESTFETDLGREDIGTFAFRRET